jgi:hypothetical protein
MDTFSDLAYLLTTRYHNIGLFAASALFFIIPNSFFLIEEFD